MGSERFGVLPGIQQRPATLDSQEGAYLWSANMGASAAEPEVEILSYLPPKFTTLDELKGMDYCDPDKCARTFKFKYSKQIPCQREPGPYTLPISSHPDDFFKDEVSKIINSIKLFDEMKWPKDLTDQMKEIIRHVIMEQTCLESDLTKTELKAIAVAVYQMKSDKIPDSLIMKHLAQAYRGQIARVILTEPQALFNASFSGYEEYAVDVLNAEKRLLEQTPPKSLSPKDGLGRVALALPTGEMPERNITRTYNLPKGTVGYVYATAPQVPGAVYSDFENNGGGMQFFPLQWESIPPPIYSRAVSARQRHELKSQFKEKHLKKELEALQNAKRAKAAIQSIVLEYFKKEEWIKLYKLKKSEIAQEVRKQVQSLLLEDIPESIKCSVKGVPTELIYKATDAALQKLFKCTDLTDIPAWIKVQCWSDVYILLTSDKSILRSALESIQGIISLAVSLGGDIIPYGDKAVLVLEYLASEGGDLVIDTLEKNFSGDGRISVQREDGAAQHIPPQEEGAIKALDTAIGWLEKAISESNAGASQIENSGYQEHPLLEEFLSFLLRSTHLADTIKTGLVTVQSIIKAIKAGKATSDTKGIRAALSSSAALSQSKDIL
jgi:hypothetical protein